MRNLSNNELFAIGGGDSWGGSPEGREAVDGGTNASTGSLSGACGGMSALTGSAVGTIALGACLVAGPIAPVVCAAGAAILGAAGAGTMSADCNSRTSGGNGVFGDKKPLIIHAI